MSHPALAVVVRPEYNTDQLGVFVVVQRPTRWWRAALILGTPPGSHIGLWRTRWGELRGINYRIGRRYIGPCLTVFLHTKPGLHGDLAAVMRRT